MGGPDSTQGCLATWSGRARGPRMGLVSWSWSVKEIFPSGDIPRAGAARGEASHQLSTCLQRGRVWECDGSFQFHPGLWLSQVLGWERPGNTGMTVPCPDSRARVGWARREFADTAAFAEGGAELSLGEKGVQETPRPTEGWAASQAGTRSGF